MGRVDNFKKRFCRACGGRVTYNELACNFCGHQVFSGQKIRIRNKSWTRAKGLTRRTREARAALRKPVPKTHIYRYAQQTGWRPGTTAVDSPLNATVGEGEEGGEAGGEELSSACGHVTVSAQSQETSAKNGTVNPADQQHAQTKHSTAVVQVSIGVSSSGQRGQIQAPEERIQELVPSPSGPQMQTHDAEEEFVQVLISSPERIRRITKELRKLQFCNPGPQMRSHATDSRLRDRPPQYLPTASSQSSEGGHQAPKRLDLCDCMDSECPGCFLPCPKCRSNKCGTVCRVGRSWVYCREVQRDRASDSDVW